MSGGPQGKGRVGHPETGLLGLRVGSCVQLTLHSCLDPWTTEAKREPQSTT